MRVCAASDLHKRRFKHSIILTRLLCLPLLCVTGCADVFYCYLYGCPTPEYDEFDEALAQLDEAILSAPSIKFRFVNETDVIVAVNVASGFREPSPPYPSDSYLGEYRSVDEVAALLLANGIATAEVKCGELIVISATAPFDTTPLYYGQQCDLYIQIGNVNFAGSGIAGESDVVGDIVSSTRCIRPADGGIDCENDTIVVTISDLGRAAIFDPQTGDLLTTQTPAAGTISIE